jgi:hypothetical protein
VADRDASVAVFWSYSREDDELDGGQVLALAKRIRDEFALITGESLEMFVDRDAIGWGDEWSKRIDTALEQTTFFIPIITPRYFTRPECRRELVTFVGRAESLGFSELVLPILYVDVPDLGEDNSDEAKAIVARTQYDDWRSHRLADPASKEYREALNGLAQRLADLSAAVAQRQLDRESIGLDNEDETPGLVELVEQINTRLAEWLHVVESDPVNEAQHDATLRIYRDRIDKLESASAPRGAVFAVLTRWARDELPLAERHLEYAETYVAKTVELDPLVHAAIRAVEDYPEGFPLLADLQDAVPHAIDAIKRWDEYAKTGRPMQEAAREYQKVSRLWRKVADIHERADEIVLEGNVLVTAWWQRLQSLKETDGLRPEQPLGNPPGDP